MARSDTDPGPLPTVAAVPLFLAGAAHVLLSAQCLLLFWWLEGAGWVAAVACGVLGALAVLASFGVGAGRSRAAVAGAALAPALLVLSTGLGVWCTLHLSFAVYLLAAPPLALLATLLVPFAVGPCRRAERAVAERLARAGAGNELFSSTS